MKTKSRLLLWLLSLVFLIGFTTFVTQSVAQDKHAASKTGQRMAVSQPKVVSLVLSKGQENILPLLESSQLLPRHKTISKEILELLPADCVGKIRNFYVRYDNPAERGLAGKNTVILTGNVPDAEFRALMVHEIWGHVMDLGCLQGTPQSGTSAYRDGKEKIHNDDPSVLFYSISWRDEDTKKKDATAADFVSGYAQSSDAFEDMAETVTFYFFHKEEFVKIAKKSPALQKKLDWVKTYVFADKEPKTRSAYVSDGSLPWDTTKLSYRWTAGVLHGKGK